MASSPLSVPAAAPAHAPGFWRKHGLKLALSAVITVLFVLFLRKGGLTLIPDRASFAHVRWWTVGAYVVTLTGMNYFRAVRWRYLLRTIAEVPRRKLVAVSWIGFAAILIVPFRIGEFVRPYMIRTPGKRDSSGRVVGAISMSTATGSVLAERIVDFFYLSLVLAIALLFVPTVHPLPDKVVGLPVSVAMVRQTGFTMLGISTVALVVVAVFYAARSFAHRATLAVVGLVSRPLAEKLATFAEKLADGLHFLGRPRDAIPFIWESTVYWAFNAGGMWLLAWGCGVAHGDGTAITFGEACGLMGMLGISILIPGGPGLLGPFQLGIYAGMTMYFPTHAVVDEGAAFVFLLYVVQAIWTVLSAGVFLVGDPKAWRALEEAEGILPEAEPEGEKLAPSNAAR